MTAADAGGAEPAALEAVTENIDVAVTLTVWLDDEVLGITLGPVHA